MKLTKSAIDTLTCPPDRKDLLVFDDTLHGFGVRVTAAGLKVFLFQYRHAGGVRRLRLGRYGELTPTEARRLAEIARGDCLAGRDPVGVKAAARANAAAEVARLADEEKAEVFTFEALIEQWAAERLSLRTPTYRREAVRSLRVNLAKLLSVPAAKVDSDMLRRELAGVLKRTPRTAGGMAKGPHPSSGTPGLTIQRRARAYAHAMYAWAVRNGLVDANPVAAVHVEGRAVSRERVLTDAELGEVWRTAGKLDWPWGPYLRFLILTLQRETETAGIRWFEISEDRTRWELPGSRTKNRKPHIVHLSETAREILRHAPRLTIGTDRTSSPFVFTTTGKAHISGPSRAKTRLDNLILMERITLAIAKGEPPKPLEPWRMHDLRRTGATIMARIGIRWEVADRILNHVGGAVSGVAAIYQRHEWLDERRDALDQWERHVLSVGNEKGPVPDPALDAATKPD
jgi:integrase